MKYFEVDWNCIVVLAGLWDELPRSEQEYYLHNLNPPTVPSENCDPEKAESLISLGFLKYSPDGTGITFPDDSAQFHKLITALTDTTFFEMQDTIDNLAGYLKHFYTPTEYNGLTESYWQYGRGEYDLASRTGSAYWISMFLESNNTAKWVPLADEDNLEFEETDGAYPEFSIAKRIIRLLVNGTNPIPLSSVYQVIADEDPLFLAKAVHLLVSKLLVFISIDPATYTVQIGIRSFVHDFLNPPAKAMDTVDVPVNSSPSFMVDDMTIILAEAAVRPIPLKQKDHAMYARSERELYSSFYDLPPGCNFLYSYTAKDRLALAMRTIVFADYAFADNKDGKLFLCVSAEGKKWLALSQAKKAERILRKKRAILRQSVFLNRDRFPMSPECLSELSDVHEENSSYWARETLSGSTYRALTSIADFKLPVTEISFFGYHSIINNPLFTLFHAGVPYRIPDDWYDKFLLDKSDMINKWIVMLRSNLIHWVIPMGLLNIGRIKEADEFAFILNDYGLFFAGKSDEIPERASEAVEIVVQPNFDIVFMAAAPSAEVQLGRFSRRVGRGMGTLFKLTRESVVRATAGGLDFDSIMKSLSEFSSKPIPPNVTEQIRNWVSQCRKISISTKILFTCPDRETALQVVSAAGKDKAEQLSDTVVAISDKKYAKALAKKLEKKGIFRNL